jgi:hypothetical protein
MDIVLFGLRPLFQSSPSPKARSYRDYIKSLRDKHSSPPKREPLIFGL